MLLSDSTVSATIEEKLRWAFKIYDKNVSGNYSMIKVIIIHLVLPGFISVAEMLMVLGTVYGLEGVCQAEATHKVKFIFGLLDTNGDEEISEDEGVS